MEQGTAASAGVVATAPVSAGPVSAGRVGWLLGLLSGLGISGTSGLAVVLPTAAADLAMSPTTAAWLLSGFALPLAVLTPVFGSLGDRYGVRWPLVVGVVVMAAGSLAAALAPSAALAIVARLVQGAGGASVAVLGAALITQRSTGRERAEALARVAGTGAAIAAVAPVVSGALEAVVGWRPVVAVPALGLLLLVPLARAAPAVGSGRPFDGTGAVRVAATVSGVVLLAQAPASGAAAAAGGASLAVGLPLLVAHVRRRPEGFLPRRVLSSAAVVTAAVGACGQQAAWFALLLLVPAALAGYGWSALAIGAALVPGAAAALVATRTSAPVLLALGTRRTLLLSAAAAVAALGLGAVGLVLGSPLLLVAATTVVALGVAHGQPAVVSQVSAGTDEDVRGAALGFATLVVVTGGALGSALVGGLQPLVPGWAVLGAAALVPLLGVAVLAPRRGPRPAI